MIQSMTHSRKNLGLVLDASFEDPLRPIHAGSGLGNCRGCSRNSLGWVTVDESPLRGALGLAMPSTGTLVGLGLSVGAGLFLWKHKTGKKIVRRVKSAVGLRGARRRH